MTRLVSLLAVLFALLTPACAAPLPLEQFLHGPGMDGGIMGVEVCDARTGTVLFAHNADTRLLPASNAKLFTAAAALELLGEQFTWTTKVVSTSKPDATGVLFGNLYVVGAGDASLVSADLDDLAKQIKAAGVVKISGNVYGDNALFTDGPYGFGWEWDDFNDEEFPQISALTVDDGDAPLTAQAGAKPGDPLKVTFSSLLERPQVSAYTAAAGTPQALRVSRRYGQRGLIVSGALPMGDAATVNVPLSDPAASAAFALRVSLVRAGMGLTFDPLLFLSQGWGDGPSSAHTAPTGAVNVLAAHTSAPLSQYVTHMLKESDNLYAECLVRTVGVEAAKKGPPGPPSLGGETSKAQSTTSSPSLVGREAQTASQNILPPNLGGRGGLPPSGTFAAGYAAELPALQKLGVDMTNVTLVDGCGVGRRNFVTARALCQLLMGMKKSTHYATFYNALPVAGVDGTLKSRMKGTPAAANCHAKTGTLGAVRALSGYVTGKGGTPYVFSILLNNFPGTAHQAGAVQDNIVEWLAAH